MKVAIVHDQLQEFGGAERVLVSLKEIFPDADVYTSFYSPEKLGIHAEQFKDWHIITSWAQKVPGLKRWYSPFRFIIPWLWESFDFREYDLVISSSGWFMCKGIITRPETLHVCYLHHPPRSFYYYETAVEWQKYKLIKIYGTVINHGLRLWDFLSSQRPDFFIANSQETLRRIKKLYRRDGVVVYPPVKIPKDVSENYKNPKDIYYLSISRLARAKHIDVLIEAANKHQFKLKIVGTGRDEQYLKQIAGDTVEFLGGVPDDELKDLYSNAKAFLFAGVDEEFGIAVAEALGQALPVIGFNSGGIPELIDGKNGYLFTENNADYLIEKIKKIESLPDKEYIEMKKNARKKAELFSEEEFKKQIIEFVNKHLITKKAIEVLNNNKNLLLHNS